MATLYALSTQYKELLNLIEDSIDMETGEIKSDKYEEAITAMGIISKEIATKTTNVVKFAKEVESRIPVIKNEIARLQKLKKSYETIQNNLMFIADNYMKQNNLDELRTDVGVFKYSNSTTCEIIDVAKIPTKYCKIETIYTPDKRAITKAIKSNEKIEGAELKEKKTLKLK